MIQGTAYKFCFSRSIEGDVKTVTVKRVGYLWICFSVMEKISDPVGASMGNIGGFDFGLQSSLTDHEGTVYHGPQFLKAELTEIARLNKAVSRKQKGSNNRRKAKRRLAKAHQRIANKHRDGHWKLARDLGKRFDLICLETLDLTGMKRMWGRKVSDLGFAEFVAILQQAAAKTGTEIVQVNRRLPTSKVCSRCGTRQDMTLVVRQFQCAHCGWSCDRD